MVTDLQGQAVEIILWLVFFEMTCVNQKKGFNNHSSTEQINVY